MPAWRQALLMLNRSALPTSSNHSSFTAYEENSSDSANWLGAMALPDVKVRCFACPNRCQPSEAWPLTRTDTQQSLGPARGNPGKPGPGQWGLPGGERLTKSISAQNSPSRAAAGINTGFQRKLRKPATAGRAVGLGFADPLDGGSKRAAANSRRIGIVQCKRRQLSERCRSEAGGRTSHASNFAAGDRKCGSQNSEGSRAAIIAASNPYAAWVTRHDHRA